MPKRHVVVAVLLLAVGSATVAGQGRPASTLERNKDVVERFFGFANAGDAAAIRALVQEDYIEHADLPDRREGLLSVVAAQKQAAPKADVVEERQRLRGDIVRMIAERDHVWTYSQVRGAQGRVARIDMFRLDGGLIAEHWAVVEPVNETRNNPNDNFAVGRGPQDPSKQEKRRTAADEATHERNRTLARQFYQYFEVRDDVALRTIMREDYIQHNAGGRDGREGLIGNMPATRARLAEEARQRAASGAAPLPPSVNNEIIRIVTEGDLVWVLVRDGGGRRAQFNQFRVEGGMLIEHWGVYQAVPDTRQNANTFFGFGRGPSPDFSR